MLTPSTRLYDKRQKRKLINEINVTPMVDVMLVLLIIFMVTAPMLVAGIEVDLPKTELAPISGDVKPVVVSINKKHEVYINDTKINNKDLIVKLRNVTKEKKDTKIFVRGDKSISYGVIMDTISSIQKSGFNKVALISDIK